MTGYFALFIFFKIIVISVYFYQKESKNNKAIIQHLKARESLEEQSLISKFETCNLNIQSREFELQSFNFTPRFFTEIPGEFIIYSLKAKYKSETLGLSIQIGIKPIEISDPSNSTSLVTPIIITSNDKDSDQLLKVLIDSWKIEKPGKPRMAENTFLYTDSEINLNSSKINKIKFIAQFGIFEKGQLDPSLKIEIDWKNGKAKISETSIINREIIVNRIMV